MIGNGGKESNHDIAIIKVSVKPFQRLALQRVDSQQTKTSVYSVGTGGFYMKAYISAPPPFACRVPWLSAFRYALMNESRSPSITACTLPFSQPVR